MDLFIEIIKNIIKILDNISISFILLIYIILHERQFDRLTKRIIDLEELIKNKKEEYRDE